MPKGHWFSEPGTGSLLPGPSQNPCGTQATSQPQPHDSCPCPETHRHPCLWGLSQVLAPADTAYSKPSGPVGGSHLVLRRRSFGAWSRCAAGCGAGRRVGAEQGRGAAPGLTRQKNVCDAGRGLGSQLGLIWPPPTGWEVGGAPGEPLAMMGALPYCREREIIG